MEDDHDDDVQLCLMRLIAYTRRDWWRIETIDEGVSYFEHAGEMSCRYCIFVEPGTISRSSCHV